MTATPPPSDDQQPAPTRPPDFEDFRDADGVIDWAAFRAAMVAFYAAGGR